MKLLEEAKKKPGSWIDFPKDPAIIRQLATLALNGEIECNRFQQYRFREGSNPIATIGSHSDDHEPEVHQGA